MNHKVTMYKVLSCVKLMTTSKTIWNCKWHSS